MNRSDDETSHSTTDVEAADEVERSARLYRRTGSTFLPSPVTAGPWRPDAQHGGPPSALLAFLCETTLGDDEVIARLYVSLLTAVPLEPLDSSVLRHAVSRRVARVEAELGCEGRPVARAVALVLTAGDLPEPSWRLERPAYPSWRQVVPTPAPHWAAGPDAVAFHRDGLEHRFVAGAFDHAGPATDWVRLRQPVVAGVELTAVQRLAGSVDVGSGISAVFDPAEGFGMINADLDVALVAPPQGDWLLLDAVTGLGPAGTGLAVTHVYDESRLVAVVTQCLLGTRFSPG